MTTKVEKSIQVNVPVSTVYNQWTQFEEFPQFMGGVSEVRQIDDRTLHWVAEIGGVKREWNATILEQVPDQQISWAATEGATNAGAVYFAPAGEGQTLVRLSLEYEPEGLIEKAGDALNIVGKRAEADLEKFKSFIESQGSETGAWRGGVNEGTASGTPGVEAAQSSQGDSGKSGISGKAAVAGVAAAAAGVAAASALRSKSGSDSEQDTDAEAPTYPVTADVTEVTTEVVTEAPATGDSYTVVEETDATYPATTDPLDDTGRSGLR
jgi:uncharacterized membrane protein